MGWLSLDSLTSSKKWCRARSNMSIPGRSSCETHLPTRYDEWDTWSHSSTVSYWRQKANLEREAAEELAALEQRRLKIINKTHLPTGRSGRAQRNSSLSSAPSPSQSDADQNDLLRPCVRPTTNVLPSKWLPSSHLSKQQSRPIAQSIGKQWCAQHGSKAADTPPPPRVWQSLLVEYPRRLADRARRSHLRVVCTSSTFM